MRYQKRFLVSVFSMSGVVRFLALGLGLFFSGVAVPPRATAQNPPFPIRATEAFVPPACSDADLGGLDIDFGIATIHVPSPQRSNPEWKAIIIDSSQPPNLQPPTILEGFVSPQASDETSSSQATAEVAEEDLPWTHYTHDYTVKVVPDSPYQYLLSSWTRFPGATSQPSTSPPIPIIVCPPNSTFDSMKQLCFTCPTGFSLSSDETTCVAPPETCPDGTMGATCLHTDMEVEWDSASLMDEKEGFQREFGAVPEFVWPAVGDRVWVDGRWIFDCGHPNPPHSDPLDRKYAKFSTEIHPPRALVTFRLNHPALDSFVVPRTSAPNFPFPQSYLPVTGCPVGSDCGPATLPPGVPNSGPTNVPVTEADIFVSVNGGAASDICAIVPVPCSAFGGHTGPIIPVNDRNYVFDIYPPGTKYVLGNGVHLVNGTFPVTPPVPDASLQWRTVNHFSELPAHACGGVDNTVCVTVDPILCLIDASTPPPAQTETACPPLPAQPTRLRVILPFAGTNPAANFFAQSILLGWDDVPTGPPQIMGSNRISGGDLLAKSATKMPGHALLHDSAFRMSAGGLFYNSAFKTSADGLVDDSAIKMSAGGLLIKSATGVSAQIGIEPLIGTPLVRSFVVRLHELTVKDNGEGCCTDGDWRVFVNVGGQWRYISQLFDAKDDGTSVCNGADPLTENGNDDCYRFDNTPWKVSVVDGTPIHVAVGGFVARGVEDHNSPLLLCPGLNYPGGCDPPTNFSPLGKPFREFAIENDDRIGTYEFDLVAPAYAPPAPFTTAQFGCTIIALTGCSLRYKVEFSVREIPAATAPSSAPLVIGLPNFTGPAGIYIAAATPMIPQTADPNAEGFQYRFHRQGGPLPTYPFAPPQPYPVHWAHVDLAPGIHSAEVRVDGANFGDGPYDFQYSAESFGNLLETRHTTTVILDTTPPVISIVQPQATAYPHSAVLTLSYTVDDGTGSGVASSTPTMDGATTLPSGLGLQSGQPINLLTELALGAHTFSITATDNVNNTSMSSVTFTIIVTPDSIKDDVRQFLQSGAIDNAGIANSLLAKLDAAARARARGNCSTAANIYQAFIDELQAQSGNHVDPAAAAIMIADAQYLIAHCP